MTHLDLFSGIGGFAYAVDQVWDDVEHIFCDNDPFCRQILKKHWPESKIYDDIRQINTNTDDSRLEGVKQKETTRQSRQPSGTRKNQELQPFIITGGFPCQPFSSAGLRQGTDDKRHLWPEMLRVIQLTQPEWIIAENVSGLLTMQSGVVFEQICLDLEASSYEVQPFIIPAAGVGAPHKRDRIWICAHADSSKHRRGNRANRKTHSVSSLDRSSILPRQLSRTGEGAWERDWFEAATEFCSVDDGVPVELDGFKLSKAGHRQQQIKAYGNSIVPQVAIEIMKGIAECR